ncbi:MAG: nucleotide exchange factor GrpE [Anaerolineae bacterium]|nr:nucleotide exchange factor GrpE [Anaerolineae bacterium]
MSERRQLWETLASFLTQLEQETDAAQHSEARLGQALDELKEEVRKLGKAQFKANAMVEGQSAQWEQAVADWQAAHQQQAQLVERLTAERVAARERELLEAFLPALDGLEHAIASGQRYLAIRDRAAGASHITPTQAVLVSPADRAMLSAWLEGLRLVQERMLSILAAGGVTPIPSVGHPFDPYLHVAVGVTDAGAASPGTIVAEERGGYRTASGVLRYAEVIVYRP